MKVLLTGAQGNFGSEFTRLASQTPDVAVTPIGRSSWDDINHKLEGIDTVIHAASDLHTSALTAPTSLLESNIMTTARLLEASKQRQVKRWIFLSSCAVYGEDMRTDETSLCCPITINGISKHLNEKLVADYCSANGIEYQIFRAFNSYGGHDQFSIFSKIKKALKNNTPFTLNNEGRMQRDFVHISDVAKIVLYLLKTDVSYTHMNIGTGVATKISTIVDLIQAQFPKLIVKHGATHEAEYSRASITRLREYWSGDFVRVEDYVRDQFASFVAA